MLVNARNLVRKMRGGAQAHMLECDDDRFYIVKFRNNPQHRRILVNELVSAVFLKYLQVSTAPAGIILLTPQFLAANPEIFIHLGTQRIPVAPGWHFGSRHPGNPEVMSASISTMSPSSPRTATENARPSAISRLPAGG